MFMLNHCAKAFFVGHVKLKLVRVVDIEAHGVRGLLGVHAAALSPGRVAW